ncbi:MAG: hypothetical protein AAB504_02465 [Patescibacteria group bacterium]
MDKKLKSIIWFLLVFFIVAVGVELMAEDSDGPTIKDFEITKNGGDLRMEFSFNNVKGGLAEAKFTVGYIIERNNAVVQLDEMADLGIASDLEEVSGMDAFETGKFQIVIPWLEANNKEIELRAGDIIRYILFLKDSAGRKSNTISYEYEFVGGWDI